jgi:transposase-like protein
MAYHKDCTLPTEILEAITANGLEKLPEPICILMNEAMKIEREQHLSAEAYERTPTRRGYANVYKSKTIKMCMGEIEFTILQVRDGISTRRRWRKGRAVNGH